MVPWSTINNSAFIWKFGIFIMTFHINLKFLKYYLKVVLILIAELFGAF